MVVVVVVVVAVDGLMAVAVDNVIVGVAMYLLCRCCYGGTRFVIVVQ